MAAPGPARASVPGAGQHAARRRRRRRRTRLAARVALLGVLSLVVGTGTFVGGLLAAPIDFEVAPPPASAILLASDGRQFAKIAPPEKREEVKATDIPDVMREAIISAEDERFLKHNGVDPLATMRALFRDITGGNTQGGSTLTQQYVKNAYVGNERTALRKIREAALAYRLEKRLSKQQIITDYLNALYLGNGLYGVQAAAKYYYGVGIKDLDLNKASGTRSAELALSRASLLAGIAPAPSAWNPIKDFATAKVRQSYTLNQMVKGGYITAQQATAAYRRHYVKRSQIERNAPPEPKNPAPEFTDYVTYKVQHDPSYDEDTFFRGGLRVKTTLDLDLEEAFQQALQEVLPNADDPQAALIAVDYQNGDIKAMATLRRVPPVKKGGKVVNDPTDAYEPHGFNLATNASRSSGSTIKTFTLAQALIEGHKLTDSRYGPAVDKIRCPACKGGYYVYGNAGDGEAGRFTLQNALAHSVNTIFVPLANDVGRDKVAKLAERAGLAPAGKLEGPCKDGYCPPAHFMPFGIGGGVDVTPLGEAVSYATIANGGRHITPRAFTQVRTGASGVDQGELLFKKDPSVSRVMPKGVASDVVKALKSVVQYGTGTSVKAAGMEVFGKTGTTNDSTDAWFTGCVPSLRICMSSWMGYEYINCTPGNGQVVDGSCGGMHDIAGVGGQIYGGTLPARVFSRALQLYKQIQHTRELRESGVVVTAPATASARPRVRASAAPLPSATEPRRTALPRPTATRSPSPRPVETSAPPIVLPSAPNPSRSPP